MQISARADIGVCAVRVFQLCAKGVAIGLFEFRPLILAVEIPWEFAVVHHAQHRAKEFFVGVKGNGGKSVARKLASEDEFVELDIMRDESFSAACQIVKDAEHADYRYTKVCSYLSRYAVYFRRFIRNIPALGLDYQVHGRDFFAGLVSEQGAQLHQMRLARIVAMPFHVGLASGFDVKKQDHKNFTVVRLYTRATFGQQLF